MPTADANQEQHPVLLGSDLPIVTRWASSAAEFVAKVPSCADVKLPEDLGQVIVNRRSADVQLLRYLRVCQAVCSKVGHAAFLRCQSHCLPRGGFRDGVRAGGGKF